MAPMRSVLLTAIGDDPVGDFVLRFLNEEGVETKFIPRKAGRRTSAAILGIEPPDRFPLVFYRDNCADNELTIDDVLAAPVADSRAIVAAEQARAANATVFLDLDFRPVWPDAHAFGVTVRSVLPLVHVAIGTEEEVLAAASGAPAGDGDVATAAKTLLGCGPDTLVIKRGAGGATVHSSGEEAVDAAPFAVEVYNVLGGGDAFASGFIYGYLKGWDRSRSARMGNACGAIVVTRHGCANFMPYEQETLDFVEERGGF
jgi:5-dehydro-2-deoxygluconokinase